MIPPFISPLGRAWRRLRRSSLTAGVSVSAMFSVVFSVLVSAMALGGCASQVPAVRTFLLKTESPVAASGVVPTGAAVWQLVSPVRVPEYLDTDALWLPVGQNGLQPAPNARWAELLSASVPRVLVQDLATLRGPASLWSGPLPQGVVVKGQLRLALLTLDVVDAGRAVSLKARWTTMALTALTPPQVHGVNLRVDSPGTDADSLVGAHRLALWRMAQAVALSLDDPAAPPRLAAPQ